MNDAPTTSATQPGTELTVAQRAAVALGAAEHEQKLMALAKQSTEITGITNPASYQQVHGTRMALKRARIAIEETGKTAREDAQAFAKAVIAEQRRLIGIIEPEETRLQGIQEAHDAENARKKAEAVRVERERVERIQAAIRDIRNSIIDVAGRGPEPIDEKIREIVGLDISAATCQEFAEQAETARTDTLAKLREMHAAALAQEAEAARLRLERAELERRQAEQDERERADRERVAAETRQREEQEAERRRQIEEEDRARRARIAQEEREARERREAADREARERREAEEKRLKVEQDRIDADRRALEERQHKERLAEEERQRQERTAAEQKEREEREAKDAEARAQRDKVEAEQRQREKEEREAREAEEARQREEQRKAAELLDGREILATFRGRFGHREEFKAVTKVIDTYLGKKEKA